MSETKELLTQINAQLESYKSLIEAGVKKAIDEGKDASERGIVEMKKTIEALEASLKANQQQVAMLGRGVPGLKEDLEHGKTKFSFGNLCKALYRKANPGDNSVQTADPWQGAEREKEIIDAYAKTRTSNYASEGQAGGYLIPQEVYGEIIPLVYAAIPLLEKLPVKKLEGLTGEIHIPKLTGGQTAYQVGENTEPTLSAVKYGEFIGRPRRSAALTYQSKTLIYQSSGAADMVVKADLVKQMSRQIHSMLMNGTGNNYQPKGLRNWAADFSSMGSNALGTNGGRFNVTDALLMKMIIEKANEGDDNPDNYGYLMRPEAKYGLLTERVTQYSGQASKSGAPVLVGTAALSNEQLQGIIGKYGTTTQLPATQTKGTSSTCSDVIFGNWSQFYTMFWEGMSIRVSDQAYAGGISAFSQNGMFIIAEQSIDCAVVRGEAFCRYTDAETDSSKW